MATGHSNCPENLPLKVTACSALKIALFLWLRLKYLDIFDTRLKIVHDLNLHVLIMISEITRSISIIYIIMLIDLSVWPLLNAVFIYNYSQIFICMHKNATFIQLSV
jgi:hypothetical protein